MRHHTARRSLLAAAATTTLLAAAAGLASTANAAQHSTHNSVQPRGWVVVESCTTLNGTVTINPGLKTKAHPESAVVSGTLDGCTFEGQSQPGQGSFTAIVSGTASTSTGTLTGTFTANWPPSSGLNPSTGNVTITTNSQGVYTVTGSVTGGALPGTALSTSYVVTGTTGTGSKHNPITGQTFVNSSPLNLGRNGG